jgi:hypothetical protein
MLCVVLLCRLSAGDASPPRMRWSVHAKFPMGGRGTCRAERPVPAVQARRQRDLPGVVAGRSRAGARGSQGSSPWEGEAPAEPKSIVRLQLSLFAHSRSPVIPAWPSFAQTQPRRGACLPVALPVRGLMTNTKGEPRHRHRAGARWS